MFIVRLPQKTSRSEGAQSVLHVQAIDILLLRSKLRAVQGTPCSERSTMFIVRLYQKRSRSEGEQSVLHVEAIDILLLRSKLDRCKEHLAPPEQRTRCGKIKKLNAVKALQNVAHFQAQDYR